MQYSIRKKNCIRNYQRLGVDFIKRDDKPGAMVLLKPGLGKTSIVLTAIRELIDGGLVNRVLIVAPLLVAEETWPEEIESWEHTRVLSYEVITGTPERREGRLAKPAEIHITNKENVVWLVEYFGADWPYDMLVIDESSCFKNPAKRTAISKAQASAYLADPKNTPKPERNMTRFGALCQVRQYFCKVVALTGTPAPNGTMGLWAQYYLIDGGERLGGTFEGFRKRYFTSDYMGYKYTEDADSFETIMNKVRDITFSLRESDWLELPPRIDNIIRVTLPDRLIKQYKKFKNTLLLEEHEIEAVNAGVLTGKLLQYANGSVYDAEREIKFIHDLKFKALDVIVEEAAGEPILIAYSYEFDLIGLKKRYPKAEVLGEKSGQVKRWNNREIELLFAHPAAASYGLNLQHGGHTCVWFGLPWSLEWFQQFNKRLHRSGQTHTTIIHMILAEGTDDERVLKVLNQKDVTQEAIFEATLFDCDIPVKLIKSEQPFDEDAVMTKLADYHDLI